MQITDFTHNHIDKAMEIAKSNYEEERQFVPILPQFDTLPDLSGFADNKLGVASFENGEMTGFLCCHSPWNNHFGTTGVKGIFSPIHAHGTVQNDREKIYARLYQAASEKWVENGVVSHAIALYAHDKIAINCFFNNGFGLRCIDAIRPLDDIEIIKDSKLEYCELKRESATEIVNLRNLLIDHLGKSPIFLKYPPMSKEQASEIATRRDSRIFISKYNNEIIAFVEIMNAGENFACDDNSMMNICGAFCLPEYRGTGAYNNLLSHLIFTLKSEGHIRLGVDFESFNPTARGFWLKHFTQYTNSVVRRVDEFILKGEV